MSKQRYSDLLGSSVTSTAVGPDDLDPLLTRDGLAAILTPADADLAVDSEEDDAFEALQEDLSPGEAERVVETMRPLSREERKIVREIPLEGLRKVDDAAEEEWLANMSRKGYHAMDEILDDSIYGDNMDNEEKLERLGRDTDLGWSIPGASFVKKIATAPVSLTQKVVRRLPGGSLVNRGLSLAQRGATAPLSAAKWAGKKVAGAAMRFIPGRDAQKAKLVKNAYQTMVTQHANWLGLQAKQAGRPVLSPAVYQRQSRPWAMAQLKAAGLPTSTKMSGADVLGAEIMGGDTVMGVWYNPITWFTNLIDVMIHGRAAKEMAPVGPEQDPNAAYQDPYADPYASQDPYADPYAAQDPYASQDPYAADPYSDPYADYAQGDDPMTGISGDDTLGAFAAEIMAGPAATTASTAQSKTKEDQLVERAVAKLRAGQPIMPGELAVLATLAKGGHPRAQRVYAVIQKFGTAVSGDESGDWLYKLNPLRYITKSSQERGFEDKERAAWSENAERQKELAKRQVVLTQAEKAKTAQEAVAQAKAQADATEAQLKAIAASISGHLSESGMGHEKPTEISKVMEEALAKAGKQDVAAKLYAKIKAGESLTKDELKEVRAIARLLQKTKVVHGDLASETPEHYTMHGAFVGACLLGNVEQARTVNAQNKRVADAISKKIAANKPLSTNEKKATQILLQRTAKLQEVARAHVSGRAFVGLDDSQKLQRACLMGAAKAAMTPVEKKQLAAINSLAKAGNPRAVEALKRLRASGVIMGGDHIGSFINDAFSLATKPITVPLKHLGQAAKWTGRKLGIISTPSSPEQARLARLRAAAQRRKAAQAKAAAADAQTRAELRAQQAIANAADAEAEAADAEALSKEAAIRTAEVEADPELAYQDDDDSGAFVGEWSAFVGAEDEAIVGKAKEKSATGMKIRAGAAMYSKIKAGDPKAKKALKTMIEKANKGDAQAKRDINAVWAGSKVVLAKKKAVKKQGQKLQAQARKAKVIAFQRKLEAKAAGKLVRVERKVNLHRMAVVERKAAAGNKKAKAYVVKQAALAKKGDKKAVSRVQQMRLAKVVRTSAPNARERRNLVVANKLYSRAQRNNPKAVRQIKVIEAAAAKGNPNAKRAVKRLKVAKGVSIAVATGAVGTGIAIATGKKSKKKDKAKSAETLARVQSKQTAGTASREELAAGSRAAQDLGDRKTAGDLAVAAAKAPAATETLQKASAVVVAKDAGNPEAKAAITESFEAAKKGDAEAIKKTANVVAVNAIKDASEGKEISQTMRDAVNLQERIAAKDPAAIQQAKLITEAATSDSPIPEATAAAVALTAAATIAKAQAAKPGARREFLEKVNPPMSGAEKSAAEASLAASVKKAEDGSITPEEGVAAEKLAERLGKPKVAAKIAALAPPAPYADPRSSLPNLPQPPITGIKSLVKETLRALTFSTRDPLANWRQGVAARAKSPTVPVTTSGWSPFAWFRSLASSLPIVAPATALAASAASLATALSAKKQASKATAAAAPAAVASPTTTAAKPNPYDAKSALPLGNKTVNPFEDKEPASSSGSEKTFKDYISEALAHKKIGKRDFNRAVEKQTGMSATPQQKEAVGKKILEFLTSRNVKIETT